MNITTTTRFRCGLLIVLLWVVMTISLAHKQNFPRAPFAKPFVIVNNPANSASTKHVAAPAGPETTAQVDIPQSVMAGGGGTSSQDNFKIEGTIGQPAAGTQMSNGQYAQTGGFWPDQATATPTPTSTPTPTPTPTPTATPT